MWGRSRTLPDGRVISFTYDPNGNVTSITPPSRPQHGFAYDETDRAEGYNPPDLGAGTWGTTLSYNLDHQVTRVTRPDGQTIDYAYDPQKGRLTSTTTPRGVYTPSYHPTTGNLTSISDPAGGSLSFTYDGSLPKGVTWSGAVSGSVTATYNNRFEVTQRKVNGGNAVSYSYNLDGQLTEAGALSLSYDPTTGLPTASSVANVTDEVGFTSFGELSSYTARYNTTELLATSFTRDDAGRITQKTETLAGTTDTYLYTYDLAGRLTDVEKNGSLVEHYAYDANSNRMSWTDPWGSHGATYDDQDRLLTADTATYTYTANGELATKTANGQTVTYEYDVTGQLLGADLPSGIAIDYVLDAGNRRVGKKVNGSLVKGWLYAGGVPAAELDGSGAVVSLFVYGRKPTTPEYLVKGGTTYRLVSDNLGSVRLVVNASTGEVAQRVDYSAFGRVLFDSNPGFQPFGYAGGLYDHQTGLVRFGARDYDPEVGRWTAKDPIGFAGGDTNLYGYVVQDAVNRADPTGLADLLLVTEGEGIVFFGPDLSFGIVVDTDNLAQSGVFLSKGLGGGANLGGGIGVGIVFREVEGVALNLDLNLKAVSPTVSVDDEGLLAATLAYGPGFGASLSATKTESFTCEDVLRALDRAVKRLIYEPQRFLSE